MATASTSSSRSSRTSADDTPATQESQDDRELVLSSEQNAAQRAGIRDAGCVTEPAYLPREVFFGRLGLAGPFFSVSASDFGRFFPATSAPSADRAIATE